MPTQKTVLLVGGTGRTGRRALRQLLDRGVSVRAIVRSGGKLPPDVAGNSDLTVIEASLLSLRDEELQRHLRGCDAPEKTSLFLAPDPEGPRLPDHPRRKARRRNAAPAMSSW